MNFYAILPMAFVILWSSAFISAKAIMADATAFAALAFRFGIVSASFFTLYLLLRAYHHYRHKIQGSDHHQFAKLTVTQMGHAALSGMLLHGFYLGGVFWALSHGMNAIIAALIISLQPVFTAILAVPFLREKISPLQWLGIVTGFAGTLIVIGFDIGETIPNPALLICLGALCASIAGTLYQKRFGQNLPMIESNIIQAAAATLLHLVLIMAFETPQITFTTQFIAGMAWQIIAVSFGAYVMFLILLKKGTANQTASLLFLIAPVAAVQGWLVLGEVLTITDILGLCLASAGVYLATRPKPA
ncbi:MAG: DMT family transporter [Candidatus Puniceispirillaceae bacterium]